MEQRKRDLVLKKHSIQTATTTWVSRIVVAGFSVLAFAGCGKKAGGSDVAAKTTELKDAMCKCAAGDAACATKVVEEQKKWGEEMTKTAGKEAKPDPEAAKKLEPIMAEYTKCMTAAMTPKGVAPASGVQVADVKNPEGKVFAQYAGTYEKAIAFRPKGADRLTVYVTRDCPTLSCSIDLSKKAAMCPKGWGVELDFTVLKDDAKAGKHPAHVDIEDFGANDSEFLGDGVEVDIQELSETTVAGSINRKSDRGNVTGSFKATLCKEE